LMSKTRGNFYIPAIAYILLVFCFIDSICCG
jgi:hypothetical protein